MSESWISSLQGDALGGSIPLEDDFFPMASDSTDIMNIASATKALLHMVDYPALPNDGTESESQLDTVPRCGEMSSDANLSDFPESSARPYKKRRRGVKGSAVRVDPPKETSAVESALRNASNRLSTHIFEPTSGTSFDSIAEAYEFYNLYSWEVGYGIRYGTNYTNGDNCRLSQDIVCQLAGFDKRDNNESARCGCKAMIRLHRSEDHGWFVAVHHDEHNHPLSENCGEKMQWNSHKRIDDLFSAVHVL